jgi:outer membrane receptor for ferrienterochelin and colicin
MILSSLQLFSSVKGKVTTKNGIPIAGVNVYWMQTNIGIVTNEQGEFELVENENSTKIVFSNVAYQSDTLIVTDKSKFQTIVLNDLIQLSEVSVVGTNKGTIKLKSVMFNTEKITAAELCKAACCNLSESFETNPSVDVSYSDAATGAKQIKLLGLPGTYVQMLTENIPNLRGISAPYGMGFIPGPWMESIQVSKGAASVVNGYEAITGQINVEFKKPQLSEIVAFNLFTSDAGRVESNLNASVKLNSKLSTGIFLHASDEFISLDENRDNYMDMPMVKQTNFINRWYYKNKNYVSQAFIRALSETRHGGQINGNYKIGIESERVEFFLKNGYVINPETATSVALILSGSTHNQLSEYGLKSYSGKQNSLFSNLIFQTQWTKSHSLTAGLNATMDQYKETLPHISVNPFLKNEIVTGIYGEYTYNHTDKLKIMGGLRADYNSLFGTLITPRVHFKYSVTDNVLVRASVGKGYRSPNIFAEYNNLLAGNRSLVIAPDLKMENAWNYGVSSMFDLDIAEKEITLSAEWYYTHFNQQVVADMDSDPHKVMFSNLDGTSFSHSLQVEASSEILKGLSVNLAHRLNIVKTTIAGILRDKPLTSKSKSLLTLSYQTPLKKWQFDYTAQINGGGRLPDPDSMNPMWEKTYKPYTVMNGQITKYFRTWSVYVGGENLTNFVQKNPIIDVADPGSADFDASMVWGPLHGRKLYVGFRWALNRDV